MKHINKYVLRQMVGPFLFFMMIFGGILWLNQALRIVDVVVSNGQSGLVFAELSFYLIPKVLETTVPVAAFAAAIFLTNRLYSESELIVFMGVGHGPANATVPFFAFGGICFVLMTLLAHGVTPYFLSAFQDRQHEIRKEYLTQFVIAGEFASPSEGVTVFFGETTPEGNLRDIIINDRRNPNLQLTHVALSGQLISTEDTPKLVLFDGALHQFSPERRTLNTIDFETLSYDLSQFAKNVGERRKSLSEEYTWDLAPNSSKESLLEFHDRIVKSLLAVIVPVLGALVLLSAGFSRAGFFVRISFGVMFMVFINTARGVTQGFVESTDLGWPLLYLPVFSAFIIIFMLIRIGQAPWKSGLKGLIRPGMVQ